MIRIELVLAWKSQSVFWVLGIFGLGLQPLAIEAQDNFKADHWLTLFEEQTTLIGAEEQTTVVQSFILYGRIGLWDYDNLFFQNKDGKVQFYGEKRGWFDRNNSMGTTPMIRTTTLLYDALQPGWITSASRSRGTSMTREPLYRIIQEDSLIWIEKAYFEQSGQWLSQLNTKKKDDREQLKQFEHDPRYALEQQGNKVDIWAITFTPAGFKLIESVVISGAGNTLKFYNGRPPLLGDVDDWTIKVERSGFINDRLNYIEAQDAQMGWQLRQSSETKGVQVSQGIVTIRAEIDSTRLYTASMTDESFITNAVVLLGRHKKPKPAQYDNFSGEEDRPSENYPIQFHLGNFSITLPSLKKNRLNR